MAPIGSLRSGLLIALSTVLLSVGSTGATSGAGGAAIAQEAPKRHGTIPADPLPQSNPGQKALSLELKAKGALFYGAWWCPACHQQKVLFGEAGAATLPYVECDKTEPGRQRCNAAEIKAYPTWVMKDKPRLVGVQSLEELKTWLDSPGSR
jgi:hypothetical protein